MAKRLKRTSRGSVILPNGERITLSEQKRLQSAVNSANRKRRIMIEQLPELTKSRYRDFGIESDFVGRKKSKSLNRFRTKNEFKQYLHSVEKLTKRNYVDRVITTYRHNYISSIKKVYNGAGKDIVKFINSLSNKELRELSLSGALENVGYNYYAPFDADKKLAVLRKQIEIIKSKRR